MFIVILPRSSVATDATAVPLRTSSAAYRGRRPATAARRCGGIAALAASLVAGPACAWVYPEHRDIALLAVQQLDAQRRATFQALWQEARTGEPERLCEQGIDAEQALAPNCIDWAALSGIAGDHSCSSANLADVVLRSAWILSVADIAAQLKADLSRIDVLPPVDQVEGGQGAVKDFRRRMQSESARADRINALRSADNHLQRADPEYATRAGSNNAHFLLARPETGISAADYGLLTLARGSEVNALGIYGWFHLSALQKAGRLAQEQLAPQERHALVRAMLFDEAFALHFLQDVFASGHIAGTWGTAAQRKGTHDFYNAAGLEVFTWEGAGSSHVLMGDAHMRPEDAARAAAAARTSLEQLLDAAAGRLRVVNLPYVAGIPAQPDDFNVCLNDLIPGRREASEVPAEYRSLYAIHLGEVLRPTPVPGLGPGLGAMPRFRSEVGVFVGLAGAIDGRVIDGGFTVADGNGLVGGVELSARIGLGLEGVMGDSGDGLVFFGVGLRGDTASTNSVADSAAEDAGGNLTAAIPSRTSITARLRMPFYLVPGDLVLLSPMYLFAPERYTGMAVTAANGGLIPWQTGWATRIGRFQFVLGREVGLTFYGLTGEDRVLAAPAVAGASARLVDYKSVLVDLPILEYRPYRSFASNQSSTLLFQLFAGVDVPYSEKVAGPTGAPTPDLHNVYSIGLRMVFDWRYYP
jgi:hypothetical protein